MPDTAPAPETVPANVPAIVPFRQRLPWVGPDLQTLRNTIVTTAVRPVASLGAHARPECLTLPTRDGSGDVLVAVVDRPAQATARPPIVLVHGLTGCESSVYMTATAAALLDRGYPVVRLNLRGAGPSRPLCRGQYHAGRTEDLHDALMDLADRLPEPPQAAVGYSLGGNMLLKYLGDAGADALIRAAASVSAPIDLAATAAQMMRPRNRIYQYWLLARMRRESTAHAADLTPDQRRAAGAARTVYDFDDRFVAPRNGFGTAARYYQMCSAKSALMGITVPTLVIHSLDDPWIPAVMYRDVAWSRNPMLTPRLTMAGGHVGFHDRFGPPAWHDRAIADHLDRMLGVPLPDIGDDRGYAATV